MNWQGLADVATVAGQLDTARRELHAAQQAFDEHMLKNMQVISTHIDLREALRKAQAALEIARTNLALKFEAVNR